MKLNGLTNNLKGNDQSLSNSYLQRIVELMRQELNDLLLQFNDLNERATEHIETQKTLVETVNVKADELSVKYIKDLKKIGENINILSNALVNINGNLQVNNSNVLTEADFMGPFTYKGAVETSGDLPVDPATGDVYIVLATNEVAVASPNGAYSYVVMPIGTVSRYEFDQLNATLDPIKEWFYTNTLEDWTYANMVSLLESLQNTIIPQMQEQINQLIERPFIQPNPVDDKTYARKNNEWVEIKQDVLNKVDHIAGDSIVENTDQGFSVTSPRIELNSENIVVNGGAIPNTNKLSLTKEDDREVGETHYKLAFKRSPFSPNSSRVRGYTVYEDTNRFSIKDTLNQKWTVFTKDYQYRKTADSYVWADGTHTTLTSLDRQGNIKEMYFPARQLIDGQNRNYVWDWLVWNPSYCPEGFENKAYFFVPSSYGAPNQAMLFEYDNGDYKDCYDLTQTLTDQGMTLPTGILSSSWNVLGEGGKALRNKRIQRILWIARNSVTGGNYAIIFGGDVNSRPEDPFDPTKCIYVRLPRDCSPGYASMGATDEAWYIMADTYNKVIQITPKGQVLEYALTTNYTSSPGNYIEYIDKNGRPAVAFKVFVDSTNGKNAMIFIEEKNNASVNVHEVDMSPYKYTGWDSSLWRMVENRFNIFFTAGLGFRSSNANENSFPSAENANTLIIFSKKDHSFDVIRNFYPANMYHGRLQLYKTLGNTIWIIPHIQENVAASQRINKIYYIKDYNFGSVTLYQYQWKEEWSVPISTNHPWFISNNTAGWNNYTAMMYDTSSWSYSSIWQQYAAVNDLGVGFLMSPDYKAFALFFRDRLFEYQISDTDSKAYDFKGGVQQLMPGDIVNQSMFLSSVEGTKYGWLIRVRDNNNIGSDFNADRTNGILIYVSQVAINNAFSLDRRPDIQIIRNVTDEVARPKHMFDGFSYNMTYDDFEKRRLMLRGIFMDICYGYPSMGIDGYYEEVPVNKPEMLSLRYDGEPLSRITI